MVVAVKPAVERFINQITFEKKFSSHTITAYEATLHQFATFLETQFQIDQLQQVQATHIKTWLAAFKQKNIDNRTSNHKISTLKSFYKFLLRQQWVVQNPLETIPTLRTQKKIPHFVAEVDMQQLLQTVNNQNLNDDFDTQLNQLVLLLLYQTGMRRQELITLQTADINKFAKQIKVLGKGGKERVIPVDNLVLSRIESFLAFKNKMFGGVQQSVLLVSKHNKPLQPRQVYTMVVQQLANFTTLSKKSPHVLRHTFATHLMNNGADMNAVKELLGHSSLAATQVYTHTSVQKLKEIYKKAHPKA